MRFKDFEQFLKENIDYRDERGEVPGEQDTGPHEYEEDTIDNEEDFRQYANVLLKQAHGDDFDPDEASDTIDGLVKKVKMGILDWGEAIGKLQSSLGE